jgi:diguanylate cyclase (GGDEF)-like protein/PAS domain S-box-containing protein
MLRVVGCLTNEHDWRLVLLAAVIALFTSGAAVNLLDRTSANAGRSRLLWLITASTATGCGIWATHFIAMSAYSAGLPVGYDLPLTLLSLVAAFITTGAGFAFAAFGSTASAPLIGGGVVGLGIAVMHFLGMAAYQVPGHKAWAPDLVLASVALGAGFGMVALWAAFRRQTRGNAVLAALALAFAVLGPHFTAMGAVKIVPDAGVSVAPMPLSPAVLAVAAGVVAIALLGTSLIAAMAERFRQRLIEHSHAEFAAHTRRIETALAHMSQGLCIFDADKRVAVCNRRYAEMYGVDPDLITPGTALEDILRARVINGTYSGKIGDDFVERGLASFHREVDEILGLSNGRFISVLRRPMPDGGVVSTHEDVTERQRLLAQVETQNRLLKQHDELLRARNLQLDAALNHMSQGLCMFDAEDRLVVWNHRYVEMYGLAGEDLTPGCPLRDLLVMRRDSGTFDGDPDEYCQHLARKLARGETYHATFELTDGRVINLVNQPIADGGWVATHEDVTERHRAEARIAHLAHHDQLTSLPNRALLRERLDEAIAMMLDGGRPFAMMLLDLNRFKEVNDTLGHPIGDALLKGVAQRLKACVRDADTIARLGGDEFAILQRTANPVGDSVALARRIIAVMEPAFDLDGHRVPINTSIGIAVAPGDGDNPDLLMRNADLALYRAKKDGVAAYRLFEPEMDRHVQERRCLELDLRNALANGEFAVHYQPLLNLEHDEICGFEALLRWRHPTRGNVPPIEFIPLAEETGLIMAIGEWVLMRACAEAARWPEHLKIAVNISPVQFKTRSLVDIIVRALATTGMRPDRLEIEITENAMVENEELAFTMLTQIHELGVRIALDDFGTGYSSLSNLRKFPFDKIKIDRSFVSDLSAANLDAIAVVRSVAQLGVSLGMTTTAEGVETAGQLEQVRAEGCTEIQGYYICAPKPAKDIEQLILSKIRKAAGAA